MTTRRSTSGAGARSTTSLSFSDRYDGVRQITLVDNFRPSEGIVDVGRSVAELTPARNRLPKAMVAAGSQHYERGDLLALDFPDEELEPAWICNRIQAIRGLAFAGSPGSRSSRSRLVRFRRTVSLVSGDAGPLVKEMRRRDIPYVVKGLN